MANTLDCDFAVIQMTMERDHQAPATWIATYSWFHRTCRLDLIPESLDSCNALKIVAMARVAATIGLTFLKPECGLWGRCMGYRMLRRFNLNLRASASAISGDLKSGRKLLYDSAKRLRARGDSISEFTTPSLADSTTTGMIYRVICWPPLPQSIIQDLSDCIVAMQKIANEGPVQIPVVWDSPRTWTSRTCTIQLLFMDRPGRDIFTREKLVLSAHKVYTQCQRRTGFFGGKIVVGDAHVFHLDIWDSDPRGIGLETTE